MAANAPLMDPYGWPVAADPFTALPPSYRQPFIITICTQCAFIGVLVWDMIISAPFDVRLVMRSNWRSAWIAIMNTAYFVSRLSALVFAVTGIASVMTIQANCAILPHVYGVASLLTIISTCYIFAVRVVALFAYSKRIIALLALLLLTELGFAIAATVTDRGQNVPFSPYCYVDFTARRWLSGVSVSILVFDSVVAGLTFYKCSRLSKEHGQDSLRLPQLLLRQGAVYYAFAVCNNIVSAVLFASHLPANEAGYQTIWTIPALAIQSCMAARVFPLLRQELAPAAKEVVAVSPIITIGSAKPSHPSSSVKDDSFVGRDAMPILARGITCVREVDTMVHLDLPLERPRHFQLEKQESV